MSHICEATASSTDTRAVELHGEGMCGSNLIRWI